MKLVALLVTSFLCACSTARSHPPEDNPAEAPVRRSSEVASPQVVGIVVDEDGSRVPCVVVNARNKESGDPIRILADERGQWAFDGLEDGYWFFSVDDTSHGKTWWRENLAHIPRNADAGPLSIQLHRARSVEALIVDESGRPVPDVVIRLGQEWIEGRKSPVEGHLSDTVQTWRSDANGHVFMRRLRPGTMSVVLDHPDFSCTVTRFDVPSSDVRLTILHGLALDGEVMQDGHAIAGARVRAEAPSLSGVPMGSFTTTTDRNGRFRFDRIHKFPSEQRPIVPTITLSIDDPEHESDSYQVYEGSDAQLPFVRMESRARSQAPPKRVVLEVRDGTPPGENRIRP